MVEGFKLLGAENFTKFLEARVDGNLTAQGPEVVDWSYNREYAKRWIILLNGDKLGEYFTLGPKPGETEFGREFTGRIPNYVNEWVVVANQGKQESEKMPENSVSLIYSNGRFEYIDEALLPHIKGELTAEHLEKLLKEHQLLSGRSRGAIVKTPWQRQDRHETIPFP